MINWADIFPLLDYYVTQDSRIFETKWKKNPDGTKTKKYFCCIVGGTCYGTDVIRQKATGAEKESLEAFQRTVEAANYYEEHKEWPK